jgi:hypothetical protein
MEVIQCLECCKDMCKTKCTYCQKVVFKCEECYLYREIGVQDYNRYPFKIMGPNVDIFVCYNCFNELCAYPEDIKEPE